MSELEIKWRVPNPWSVVHSVGPAVRLDAVQDGNTIVGTARRDSENDLDKMTGTWSGSVDGDDLSMTIYWPDGSTKEYLGTVDVRGRVQGTTFDPMAPDLVTNWHGDPALSRWE